MSVYPVVYQAEYEERRNRLTVFFRLLLAIPHVLAMYVIGLGVGVATIVAWFAIVITGHYPRALYDFNARALQWLTRLSAYLYLQTDTFPPFGFGDHDEYPVHLLIGEPKAEYSRVKAFFRLILAIPVAIIQYALQLVAGACALAGWVVAVITGRMPKAIHDGLDLGLAYQAKSTAYLLLLTESWPPFSGNDEGALFPAAPTGALAVSPSGGWTPPTANLPATEHPGGLEG